MTGKYANPYVGLRPFEVDESLLFFGRNDQVMELLLLLHQHHFVAVVGSSGCGKSSLLKAGVIPSLKAGYLIQDRYDWHIGIMRPGRNPLYNLVRTLMQLDSKDDPENVSGLLEKIETNGVSSILEFLVQVQQKGEKNYFLLVDQFEELFRFATAGGPTTTRDEANEFVNILLQLSEQKVVPVYVIITMRSDFLGDCTQFYGLPEAMNKSLFLVPKLNRVQMKMAIEGPSKLYGCKLNSALTSRLLNEVGKYEDELPLLQHALMRIWDHEMTMDKSGELDLNDYDYIGGLREALSKHADEAVSALSKTQIGTAREIFQALTMIDEHGRKIRRPVLLSQLISLTGSTKVEVMAILENFIKGQRSFLIVNDVADQDDKFIDISHESLIRQWHRLSRWMDEEAESSSQYLGLADATKLNKEQKKDALTGSELHRALEWRNHFKPTPVWANRYRVGFESAMEYLDQSEAKWIESQKLEKQRVEKEQRSKKRVRALLFGVLGLVVISGIAVFTSYNYKKQREQSNELAKVKDSVARVATRERDEAKKQLELLEGARVSIDSLIAQTPTTDYSTKTKLEEVSQQVGGAISNTKNKLDYPAAQPDKAVRKSTLQSKIDNDADNPRVIRQTLASLNGSALQKLSPEELVNAFYYLKQTNQEAWTPALTKYAHETLTGIDDSIKSGKFSMGRQAAMEMKVFKDFLAEIAGSTKSAGAANKY